MPAINADSQVVIPHMESLTDDNSSDDLPLYMQPADVKIVSANELLTRCRLYLSESDCQTILKAYRTLTNIIWGSSANRASLTSRILSRWRLFSRAGIWTA